MQLKALNKGYMKPYGDKLAIFIGYRVILN